MTRMYVYKIIVLGIERETYIYAESESEARKRLLDNFKGDVEVVSYKAC